MTDRDTGMEPRLSAKPARWPLRALLWVSLTLAGQFAWAQTPVSLFQSFVGHVNYEATGGSLRTQPNTVDPCALTGSSTGTIAGMPGGATIRAGYLYWSGSGSTLDTAVTLNGSTVNADRTFTATFVFNGTDYDFFSGFADVTPLIAGNGSVTFSGLSANNGSPHCSVQAVLAGWALVVVYEDASEDLRAVNVFDGFQFFRGSALNLTVDTFRIPPTPVNGKVTHITWEGDPQNSGSLGGFSESLTFNGSLLDDGLVPPGSSPAVQQFDGTVNTLGVTTSYGVDVDTYDVSSLLSPGDTSATTTYSSGADLVLLSAEVISFTTEPVVDLEISKTHTGDFLVGAAHDYDIQVNNNGPENEPNPIQVVDTLPAGLAFLGYSGSGWLCAAVGQDVTCDHPGPLAVGAGLPSLTLTVQVGAAAAPIANNTATVGSASVDGDATNDSSTDPTNILVSDLSTSTKTVLDLNGSDADPGDVLRYTITLQETANLPATGVRVTDDIPVLINNFTVISLPPGSTDASTGVGTGANGTGFLDVTGIAVAAGGTAALVFEVTISGAANPGDVIANLADVISGNGIGAQPLAPNVIVSQSQIPNGGTKRLYLFDGSTADPNGFNQGPAPYLSRTPPPGGQGNVPVDKTQAPVTWRLTPEIQSSLSLDATSVPVTLYVSKGGGMGGSASRTLTASLATTGAAVGPLGTPVTQTFAAPPSGSPIPITFNIPHAGVSNLPAATQINLTLTNTTPGMGNRRVRVFPLSGGNRSTIDLPALNVIDVVSSDSFDAPYPGGAPAPNVAPGASVSLRAQISDPFGSFDINQVRLDLTDSTGTPLLAGQLMTRVADTAADAATFEFTYVVPLAAAGGTWSFTVTAFEGTEGTIEDTRTNTFNVVVPPLILVTKSAVTVSDPVNGATDAKAIPGAVVLYTVEVLNQGSGPVDSNSLVVTDTVPVGTAVYVDTGSGDPVSFLDGAPPSGLIYNYSTDVTFSNQPGGGPPYSYVPTPDPQGYDPLVTGLRVNPGGALNPSGAPGDPGFQLRFQVRLD